MAIRLTRIHIQNFKPFEELLVVFDSQNLVVFDGPNGFGKTSFFDAIELLFTGRLRRYSDLIEKVVDKRQSSTGSPLLNDSGKGDLVIKGEFDVDGNTVCLARKGDLLELLLNTDLDDLGLRLYEIAQFDNADFTLITDENRYLTSLLGEDYVKNFEFLNYIEQEENIHLLKNKGTDRQAEIAHLFNTSEFNERINKLIEVSKKIGKLCGKEARGSLFDQKIKLDTSRSRFTGELSPVSFTRLIPWKEIPWDAEKLEFPDVQFLDWLGEGGELERLGFFIVNLDEFRKNRGNKKLDKILADDSLVTQFFHYWGFIDNADDFNNKLALKISINDLFQSYERGIVESVKKGKIDLTPQIQELVKSVIDVQDYSDLIKDISSTSKNVNVLARLLVDVKESRQAFIEKFTKYEIETGPDNSCPLCGYSWQDADELRANFDIQADQLEQLIKTSGTELNLKLEKFVQKFLVPIKKFLEEYKSKNPVDELFVTKLNESVDNRASLGVMSKQFAALDIDIKPLLNDKPSAEEEIDLEKLRAIVSEKKQTVNQENIRSYFEVIFLQIFDESYKQVSSIEKSVIQLKRKYIEWQHSLNLSVFIKKLEKEYDRQYKVLNDAKLVKNKIDNLRRIYKNSLNTYQRSLIENIEILFHIYSGRIALETKGSLGLFIGSDRNGIRFLENPSKQHDAILTMSSGQLATLIIAFTLALNKRYSEHKILFIDDPIQTLDELNIAGLVELLRNEFSDRQIFISTHEDMMSAYMRYKFEKYGLDAQRLSFKEILLSSN